MFGDSLSVHLGPPVPLLASLRSMPPAIDLVAGARGELSRSVKQFPNSLYLTALRRDRSARSASGAAMGRTRPEV